MEKLFLDLLGQVQAKNLLLSALKYRKIAPAYLFNGPKGVGLTIAVLRFLEGLIVGIDGNPYIRRRLIDHNYPDLMWIEPTYLVKGQLVAHSDNNSFDINQIKVPQIRLSQVKEALAFLGKQPLEGPYGIVIIKQAELMSEGASNALLKTLENPGNKIIVLISTRLHKIPLTICSRCQHIPFRSLDFKAFHDVITRNHIISDSKSPELFELAAGSPGILLFHIKKWQSLPRELPNRLLNLRLSSLETLILARDVCENLDSEQQVWLLNWWQWQLWNRYFIISQQFQLERLRGHLMSYINSRLAWEVALLGIRSSIP